MCAVTVSDAGQASFKCPEFVPAAARAATIHAAHSHRVAACMAAITDDGFRLTAERRQHPNFSCQSGTTGIKQAS
eukprot:6206272-Pleurochrysis_carterae.AAC.2